MTQVYASQTRWLDEPVSEYTAALGRVRSLSGLRTLLDDWREFCWAEREIVATWTEQDYRDFQAALWQERRGEFAGEEAAARFGAGLMPTNLFIATVEAQRLSVPTGAFVQRALEVGRWKFVGSKGARHIVDTLGAEA